ncbi:MAG TPA: hypothetical protein VEK57_03170 [Thermoanaerobaculia bacterium]|nr:hypothetical protein [Thermoanaerobaculia bacterium]
MRRRLIAAVWIAGATIPLLVTTVYMVGCCVLPFHGVMHKLMPLCQMAVDTVRGEAGTREREAQPPAREKQEPVKRIVTTLPQTHRLVAGALVPPSAGPRAATAYRSFITLGATRCDRDVGLHLLVETFRI